MFEKCCSNSNINIKFILWFKFLQFGGSESLWDKHLKPNLDSNLSYDRSEFILSNYNVFINLVHRKGRADTEPKAYPMLLFGFGKI